MRQCCCCPTGAAACSVFRRLSWEVGRQHRKSHQPNHDSQTAQDSTVKPSTVLSGTLRYSTVQQCNSDAHGVITGAQGVPRRGRHREEKGPGMPGPIRLQNSACQWTMQSCTVLLCRPSPLFLFTCCGDGCTPPSPHAPRASPPPATASHTSQFTSHQSQRHKLQGRTHTGLDTDRAGHRDRRKAAAVPQADPVLHAGTPFWMSRSKP